LQFTVSKIYQPSNLGLALANNAYLCTGQKNHTTPLTERSYMNNEYSFISPLKSIIIKYVPHIYIG